MPEPASARRRQQLLKDTHRRPADAGAGDGSTCRPDHGPPRERHETVLRSHVYCIPNQTREARRPGQPVGPPRSSRLAYAVSNHAVVGG